MVASIPLLEGYDLVLGVLTSAGVLYLLYSQRHLVGYRRFIDFLVGGVLLFTLGGPIADLVAPTWIHAVHGTAALFVIFGLYDPVHNNLRKAEWAELVLADPAAVRDRADWMVPMDEEILELFHSADLVLTPTIIAYNLGHSREPVSRRLSELCANGFVERTERGKYRMTDLGERYLGDFTRPVPTGTHPARGSGGSTSRGPGAPRRRRTR